MRIITFTTIAAVVACVSAAPTLKLSLSGLENVFEVDNLKIRASLLNAGHESVKLLKDPRSVLSAWRTNTFVIEGAAGTPAFTGIAVKYSPKLALEFGHDSGFVVLKPGQSFELVHDLAGVYNFTRSGPGEYKFSAGNTFQYVDDSGKLASITAETQTHSLKLSGSLVSLKGVPAKPYNNFVRRDINFISCSSSQQAVIVDAANAANKYVAEVSAYFKANSRTNRYSTWFGVYDPERYDTVRAHFNNIGANATNMSYDCTTCLTEKEQASFAYVYHSQYGTIYLCDAFWPAPITGSDSKAGTIVHEQSHFTKNGGTGDFGYGPKNATELAETNPNKAVMNADSHEYFAENTPAQP